MRTISYKELPAFLTKISVIIRGEVEAAIKSLVEEIYTKTVSKTRFSFQRWELDEIRTPSEVAFIVRLPFQTSGGEVPFTSNLWNNPYFADKLGSHASKIHQPLQEAMTEIGLQPIPGPKVPIAPVPWPNPPNTPVFIGHSSLLRIIRTVMRRALTKI